MDTNGCKIAQNDAKMAFISTIKKLADKA